MSARKANQILWLRPQPIQHPRKRNCFSHVLYPAHPGGAAFDAHAETGVGDAAVAAEVEVPFERFAGQAVGFDLFFEIFERGRTLAAADDLAVALGGE